MNEYPDMATVEVGDEFPSMDKRAEKQNYSCTAQLASTRIAFITIGNMPTTRATKTWSYMGLFKVLGSPSSLPIGRGPVRGYFQSSGKTEQALSSAKSSLFLGLSYRLTK